MSTDVQWKDDSSSSASAGEMPLQQHTSKRIGTNISKFAHLPAAYLHRYRQFIQKYRSILRIFEDGLCRLVLYAPGRFVAHSEDDSGHEKKKILPETLYAFIHVFSLFNDAVYHGFGNGNGFTVGGLNEECDGHQVSMHSVRVLRSILSIVECMAPSLEVSAFTKSRLKMKSKNGRGEENSNFASHHDSHLTALLVSAKIEKMKFVCRMGLIAINYYKHVKNTRSSKSNAESIGNLSSLGILQEGGLLEPDECITSKSSENDRVKKLLYVGKRTGRKIIHQQNQNHSKTSQFLRNEKNNISHECKSMLDSPRTKMALLGLGELLHVYRPVYYVKTCLLHVSTDAKDSRKRMLKSWLVSLCMDVLSYKLTKMSKTVQRGNVAIDTSSDSTKEELRHRKMRWTLYLLRAPIWDMATHPLAEKLGAAGEYIPLIGKPLVQYIMDILCYWQRWHFMLEG